jgi:hypothetical protein
MEIAAARSLAHQLHAGRRTRHGDLLTEHLERVAAAVPGDAMVVAFLHDTLEHSALTMAELDACDLTEDERAALLLLTRETGESFEAHCLRIAFARGPGSRLALTVKLADLDDHVSSRSVDGAPAYGWARRHLTACRRRLDAGTATAA